MEGAAGLRLDLLHFLQPPAGDEEAAGVGVVGQHLAELAHHVLEDVGRGIVEERLQGRQVDALLEDVLEGTLGLKGDNRRGYTLYECIACSMIMSFGLSPLF